MRIFKNTWFDRFAVKEGITDEELWDMVDQLEEDQADANLGGGVYKVRVARPGEGKLGGHRVIVFFRSGERTFYQYAFAKSSRDNINQGELRFYKKMAKVKLAMTDSELAKAIAKCFTDVNFPPMN